MFFVFRKEKILSYLIAISMVFILFAIATVLPKNTIETSTKNQIENKEQYKKIHP